MVAFSTINTRLDHVAGTVDSGAQPTGGNVLSAGTPPLPDSENSEEPMGRAPHIPVTPPASGPSPAQTPFPALQERVLRLHTEVWAQLEILAGQRAVPVQHLISEALADFLEKNPSSQIAAACAPATAPAALPTSTLDGTASIPGTLPPASAPRGSAIRSLDEEEKLLAGRVDVNLPALLTRDVPGG